MTDNRRKIVELESLRGLAALLVVVYHIPKWNPILDVGLINNAYLMVELFFVISGFVIFTAYAEKIRSPRALLEFQFLRLGRLYPVHLLFLFLFLLIEAGKYFAVSRYGVENIHAVPFKENSPQALIEQALLLQAILPNGNAVTFNPPAWSISVEFYTYIVFGMSAFLFGRNKTRAMALLSAVPMALLIADATFGMGFFLRCLAGFFLGCLTARFANGSTFTPPKYASLLLFLSLALYLQIKPKQEYDSLVFFLTAALIASLVLRKDGWLNGLLVKKPLAWLGEISYSVYMSQAFVIWVVTSVFKRIFQLPEVQHADGYWAASLPVLETTAAALITVAFVILFSQIIFFILEKPMRERSRKFVFSLRA